VAVVETNIFVLLMAPLCGQMACQHSAGTSSLHLQSEETGYSLLLLQKLQLFLQAHSQLLQILHED
jgi:hypothetical protein